MNANIITPVAWFSLGLYIFLILICSYQAYMNLFMGKVSRFSFDALVVYLIIKFGNEKARKRARVYDKDIDRIKVMGIYSAFAVVGGIYELIRWMERYA